MAKKKKINIPLHLFGDRVSFSIEAEHTETYSLPILFLHSLPDKEYLRKQLESSSDAETFARNRALLEFADGIKNQNLWSDIKKVYIEDATKHTYSGRVAETVTQAFGH